MTAASQQSQLSPGLQGARALHLEAQKDPKKPGSELVLSLWKNSRPLGRPCADDPFKHTQPNDSKALTTPRSSPCRCQGRALLVLCCLCPLPAYLPAGRHAESWQKAVPGRTCSSGGQQHPAAPSPRSASQIPVGPLQALSSATGTQGQAFRRSPPCGARRRDRASAGNLARTLRLREIIGCCAPKKAVARQIPLPGRLK